MQSLSTRCGKPDQSALAALSFDEEPVKLSKYLPTIRPDASIVVFVGAMAHGFVSRIGYSAIAMLIVFSFRTVQTTLQTTWWTRRLPSRNTRLVLLCERFPSYQIVCTLIGIFYPQVACGKVSRPNAFKVTNKLMSGACVQFCCAVEDYWDIVRCSPTRVSIVLYTDSVDIALDCTNSISYYYVRKLSSFSASYCTIVQRGLYNNAYASTHE